MMFSFSRFPFDDATYPRLTAAHEKPADGGRISFQYNPSIFLDVSYVLADN